MVVVQRCELIGNDGEILFGSCQEGGEWKVVSVVSFCVICGEGGGGVVRYPFDVRKSVFESAQGVVDGPLLWGGSAVGVPYCFAGHSGEGMPGPEGFLDEVKCRTRGVVLCLRIVVRWKVDRWVRLVFQPWVEVEPFVLGGLACL